MSVRENHPIGKIISGQVGRQLPKLKVAIPSPKPTVSDYPAPKFWRWRPLDFQTLGMALSSNLDMPLASAQQVSGLEEEH